MRTFLLSVAMTAIAAPALSLFHGAAEQPAHLRAAAPHTLTVSADTAHTAAPGTTSSGDDDTGWG